MRVYQVFSVQLLRSTLKTIFLRSVNHCDLRCCQIYHLCTVVYFICQNQEKNTLFWVHDTEHLIVTRGVASMWVPWPYVLSLSQALQA